MNLTEFANQTAGQLARRLHLSLARADIRRARDWFNEASEGGWKFNSDQIDWLLEQAHDARRDAREHIRQALS